MHNKYYDGFNVPVENFSDLLKNPPNILIIGSLVYEEKIRNKLRQYNIPIAKIISLRDFLVNIQS